MKLWSTEHIFSHPFKKVTEAAWRKYPNEQNTNVVAIDVLDRNVTSEGKIHTTRIFGSHWHLPQLITALLGMPEMCYAVEHSEVDLKNEKMTLNMINYTFWGILAVEETLVYEPNKENINETLLTQSAIISINGIQFSSYFEGVLVNNFESTSQKGRSALEQVLNKIKVENMLDAVRYELTELSSDLDKATAKFDSEYHVSDRIQNISEDLDRATSFINTELQHVSSKLKNEFDTLVNKLDTEIHQISIELKTKNDINSSNQQTLTSAVKQAGITAIQSN